MKYKIELCYVHRQIQFFLKRHVQRNVGIKMSSVIAYRTKMRKIRPQHYIHEVFLPRLLPFLEPLANQLFKLFVSFRHKSSVI